MKAPTELESPSERERLLDAMAELCARQGYVETTVEQVVERAGVPAEAFDELFDGDKEECALAAQNAILSKVVTAVSSTYSPDRSEWDNAIYGIAAILEIMAVNPSFATLGYIVSRQMGPTRVQGIYETGHKLLTAMLARGWEYSDSETQPTMAPVGALGGPEAIIRREAVAGRIDQLPRLLPDFIYAATIPFLGQEEALRLARRGRELLRGTAWE